MAFDISLLDLDFEKIIPWNGLQDTGRDVRLKLDRNWQRVSDAFKSLLEDLLDSIIDIFAKINRMLLNS